jgi:hypothetical protein
MSTQVLLLAEFVNKFVQFVPFPPYKLDVIVIR